MAIVVLARRLLELAEVGHRRVRRTRPLQRPAPSARAGAARPETDHAAAAIAGVAAAAFAAGIAAADAAAADAAAATVAVARKHLVGHGDARLGARFVFGAQA